MTDEKNAELLNKDKNNATEKAQAEQTQAELNQTEDVLTELTEDMEVISPGQMLTQARVELGLAKEDIASRLNFRLILVENIESDYFDSSLPETFNRGYLRSYAKLVNISSEDVLASYEMLTVAKIQCAEMQSFSKITEKEAQNSRLMWVSYLIVALLIGSTVMWWMQEQGVSKKVTPTATKSQQNLLNTNNESKERSVEQPISVPSENKPLAQEKNAAETSLQSLPVNNEIPKDIMANTSVQPTTDIEPPIEPLISQAIFTFSGDCWVNIYDDTGERVAWGVKKAGYVMSISGKAPFKVTVGKPELAVISFNGQSVDMSQFSTGNIAKFTLPLSE